MPSNGSVTTLAELAKQIGAHLVGDGSVQVDGIAPIDAAQPTQVTFLANSRYGEALKSSAAAAVIIAKETPGLPMAQLIVADPYYGYAQAMNRFHHVPRAARGISADARLATQAIGVDPDIAAFVSVAAGSVLGDRVTLHPGVRIGSGCSVGDDVVLHDNVVLRDGCTLGNRVVVHAGTVIGSDGFGYATHQGVHHKIPHVGIVRVEDDVELGANCAIDRGVMGDTVIGAGTKLDNLVQIAHNVQVGRGCLMAAQSGVSGSSRLGNFVVLGGQVGVSGHLKVGDQSMVGGKAGVTKSLSGGQMYSGFPAAPHREYLKGQALVARIPALRDALKQLTKRLEQLESGDP